MGIVRSKGRWKVGVRGRVERWMLDWSKNGAPERGALRTADPSAASETAPKSVLPPGAPSRSYVGDVRKCSRLATGVTTEEV